ncbi:MAG TPA: DUF1932 domain-containing protein [Candidatus Acidoferrales bacterium]|nr:DUF1932 domain-containing protein [Candidatus Acidoferrales bacterium]
MTAPAPTVGLLPPGETGAAVGVALRAGGVPVRWVGHSRSQATRLPAVEAGLTKAESLPRLLRASSDRLVYLPAGSGPPGGGAGRFRRFSGCSLRRQRHLARECQDDPDHHPGERGELRGRRNHRRPTGAWWGHPALLFRRRRPPGAAWFEGSDRLTATVLEGPVGAASALKRCYPAWTKGTTALLLAVRAAATALGGEEALLEAWKQSQPVLAPRFARIVKSTPRQAGGIVAAMEQIAETWEAMEGPGGFHRAAAEVYARLAQFQNQLPSASLDELLGALQKPGATDMAAESRPVPPDPCGPC